MRVSPRPLLVDACCCQGGASRGYWLAGFDVLGIDKNPQRRYPFPFIQGDAAEVTRALLLTGRVAAVHASCPCQRWTGAQQIMGNEHPDLITPMRAMLAEFPHIPYVMENVPEAPLRPDLVLCGAMFPGLRVYRHRVFESNIPLAQLPHPDHVYPQRKMGRPPQPGDFMHVVGNFSGVAYAKRAMGIEWMTRDGLREAIPPAYAETRRALPHGSPSESVVSRGGGLMAPDGKPDSRPVPSPRLDRTLYCGTCGRTFVAVIPAQAHKDTSGHPLVGDWDEAALFLAGQMTPNARWG